MKIPITQMMVHSGTSTLNRMCLVLWRKRSMPSQQPAPPPIRASHSSVRSGIRRWPFCLEKSLSRPYRSTPMALMAIRYERRILFMVQKCFSISQGLSPTWAVWVKSGFLRPIQKKRRRWFSISGYGLRRQSSPPLWPSFCPWRASPIRLLAPHPDPHGFLREGSCNRCCVFALSWRSVVGDGQFLEGFQVESLISKNR